MIRAALSVDESSASPFGFVKHPKVGDRIGVSRCGTRTIATIVGMRRDEGPDGLGTLLVFARSAA